MDYLEYKGYKGTVEYSKEDNCLFGKVIGMSQDVILYEGQTLDELRSDFEAGIDDYIAGCIAEGVEPGNHLVGVLISVCLLNYMRGLPVWLIVQVRPSTISLIKRLSMSWIIIVLPLEMWLY